MENKKLDILITIFLVSVFSSCATFSKKGFRKEIKNLKPETISKLNGNYSFNPVKRYSDYGKPESNDSIPDPLMRNNAYMYLLNKTPNKGEEFDSISSKKNNFHINLTIEANNLLKIRVLENSKIIKDTILVGKYRNGMFYVNNNFLKCHGIPYLFGGCSNNKRRIGITKKGSLLINEAVCNEGAMLLLIGAGENYNLTYEYKRKK